MVDADPHACAPSPAGLIVASSSRHFCPGKPGVRTPFARVIGKTDETGRFNYSVTLPKTLVGLPTNQGQAVVNLHVTVTDTAGQIVEFDHTVTVVTRLLNLTVVPEAMVLVPGLPNVLDVFVTDPLGAPVAAAAVQIQTVPPIAGTTDIFGHVALPYTPNGNLSPLNLKATSPSGASVSEVFNPRNQVGSMPILVRTDKAVYDLGDPIKVEIRTAPDRKLVYVDWVNNSQTIDMRTLDVKDGVARFEASIDGGVVESNRIEAYVVDAKGLLIRTGRTFFARKKGALSVELSTDKKEYAPGASAELTLSVKDETGAPAVAALGVQIVDEAVFALSDSKPGLFRTAFELDDSFAQPSFQIRAPSSNLTSLIYAETTQTDPAAAAAAQIRASATFAALGGMGMMGIQQGSYVGFLPLVKQRLANALQAEKQRLIAPVTRATLGAHAALKDAGCSGAKGCGQVTFMLAVRAELRTALDAWDFWGNAYRKVDVSGSDLLHLVSDGPDEKAGTDDDGGFTFSASDLSLPPAVMSDLLPPVRFGAADAGASFPVNGPAFAAPAAPGPGFGTGGATAAAGAGGASGSSETALDEPRVRKDFPETLYVNPQVITGPDGKATLKVPMADSITEWRVTSLDHTLGGKLGGGVGGIRVFQDFFVDLNFPATSTRNDELDFPIAVYNYLDREQTVRVQLDPADWFAARGPTFREVALKAGQVLGLRFPARVLRAGRHTLTVKATGAARADAVARSILVEPDGKAVSMPVSGALEEGTVVHEVSFPASAIPDSQQLVVNIFPAYLSQVVAGMDSLLRVPSGCFEQTTSTAWPNVLVTDYLKATQQLKPAVQLKAEALTSAGYQRLLTFEHKGGGFSWFGPSDGKPFLSVTAFGLMEFADMAKVHPIDEAMLERTRRWMISQQQADGSWMGDKTEFFSFQNSTVRNTAFVVWALAAAGHKGSELARGLDYVKKNAPLDTLDAYALALIANSFAAAAPSDPFSAGVIARLERFKKSSGDKISWDSSTTQTSFYGGGPDATVTTTALVAHALLLGRGDRATANGALAYLLGARDKNGNFGSTQATIWTLRALLLAAREGNAGAVGSISVDVDDAPFSTVALTAEKADVMTTLDLSSLATTGAHRVALRFVGTGKVSYHMLAQHHIPWSAVAPAPAGPLGLTVTYDKTRLRLDDSARATVTLRNLTRSVQDMVMVTVGIPPGFDPSVSDLDALVKRRLISRHERTARQLILYVTSLPGAGTLKLDYQLRGTMPVRAVDGGAEASFIISPNSVQL